jgi:hypothetical protein
LANKAKGLKVVSKVHANSQDKGNLGKQGKRINIRVKGTRSRQGKRNFGRGQKGLTSHQD